MKKIIAILSIVLLMISLGGCIADNKGKQNSEGVSNAPSISIPFKGNTLPLADIVDTKELQNNIKTEIQTSSNSTQSQLSGLFNSSISKLGEKVTGVEANVDSLAKITNNMSLTNTQSATAVAEIKTNLTNTIQAIGELKAEMTNI